MARKLEAQEDYVPKHGIKQTKTWYISRLGVVPHNPSGHNHQVSTSTILEGRPGTVDEEGDTSISGVSGLSTSQLAAIVNAVNSKNNEQIKRKKTKPLAPWQSPE